MKIKIHRFKRSKTNMFAYDQDLHSNSVNIHSQLSPKFVSAQELVNSICLICKQKRTSMSRDITGAGAGAYDTFSRELLLVSTKGIQICIDTEERTLLPRNSLSMFNLFICRDIDELR